MNPFRAAVDTQQRTVGATTEYVTKLPKLAAQVDRVADIEVGLTPNEVVYEENKLELLHYTPEMAGIEPETRQDVPILIVYALINKPYILDLQPDRSVIRRLLEGGFDVYLIDWGEPSRLDSHLTIDDYVRRYTDNCVDVVAERSDQASINLLGYCMGGTMSVMYASLFPEKVRNLGLMAAGLCFDDTGGVLELWGQEEYYDAEQVADSFGNIPAEFLDIGFALMDPVSNYVSKYLRLYDNVEDDEFVENFARMERWLDEGIDVAGETYREFIEEIYQDNKLARNEFSLGDDHVDLGEIEMPVVQVIGHYDHLIPPESSTGFNDLVPGEVTTFEARSGHIGLSVSSKSHDELWPNVAAWFAERSQPAADEAEPEADGEEEPGAEADTEDSTEPTDDEDHEADHSEDSTEPTDTEEASDSGPSESAASELDDYETADDHDAADDHEMADDEDTGETADDEDAGETAADSDPDGAAADVLESVHGIGPYYAERLQEVGVDGIDALAAADADDLAAEIDVPADRLAEWIESAATHEE